MSELKPCPFCGYDRIADTKEIFPGKAQCTNCGATAPNWNTRPIEDALRAENELLRKALGGLLHIIEEHGTPIQKAHATKLLEAREALEVKG